jgi:quinone-modifying oxidoreductase subunit QmoC
MTEKLEPDLDFKRRIIGLDARDLSFCYQCGTCSAVCPISTEDNPFPRKEMIWVQWGLKERALANPSIWMCHQCGECSAYCPRDAKPASVMAALRDYSITHYAVPRFFGAALSEPKYLPLLFALPVAILLAILAGIGNLGALPEGRIVFAKLFPDFYVEALFDISVGLAILGALAGGARYWSAMLHGAANGAGDTNFAVAFAHVITDILKHGKFKRCNEDSPGTRPTYQSHLYKTHLAVFYGFLGLVVTTTSVGIGIHFFDYLTPWPLWHPVKILGNVSGTTLVIGLAVFLWHRIGVQARAGKSTYTDWLFLIVLLLAVASGFACELLRLGGLAALAYPTYFAHLTLVFFLLVYFPYSKFGHVVYRTAAMLYTQSALEARRLVASASNIAK